MSRAGFTGARGGMSERQRNAAAALLVGVTEFHHGSCLGADEQMHKLALAMDIPVHLHPGPDGPMRAQCPGAVWSSWPRPFLSRNHAIVACTEFLIAAPADMHEKVRSGTWSTIRYARKIGRPVFIVYPDGTIKEERPNAIE